MKYIIKSQRDGWYFTGFDKNSGGACYGKILEAKIYNEKFKAYQDLKKMDSCGQRIVAVTRMGKNRFENTNNSRSLSY